MKRTSILAGLGTSLLVTLGSLYQTVRYILDTPPGFVYPLVHNYEQDYYWYLSLMRQGWDGMFAVTTKYSPERFAPVAVNTFFPFIGFIARIIGVGLPVMYTLARIAGGWALLFAGFLLIRRMFTKELERWPAFLLTIVSAPLMLPAAGRWVMAGDFWTGLDPILRVTWLPHHTIANALVILVVLLSVRRKTERWLPVAVAPLAFGAVWLNPAAGLLLWCVLGVGITTAVVRKGERRHIWAMAAGLGGSAAALLLLYAAQNSVFPWTAFRDWERFNRYPIGTSSYLAILGLPGVVAFPGIYAAFRNRSYRWLMVVAWFLFPFAGILGLAGLLGTSNIRFLQSAGYIPAAMLAVYGVADLVKLLKWRERRAIGSFLLLPAVTAVLSFPAFSASIRMQNAYIAQNMNNPLVMVPTDVMNGISFLDRLGTTGVVIAPGSVSVLIPAFTPDRVYAGHPTFTYNGPGENKAATLASFFNGMKDTDRQHFVDSGRPAAVWMPAGSGDAEFPARSGYAIGYYNGTEVIWVKK